MIYRIKCFSIIYAHFKNIATDQNAAIRFHLYCLMEGEVA